MYKVIQWATGNVGRHALRAIIESPELELVGVYTYNPAKAGQDAGELAGLPPTGIKLSNDPAEVLAADADVVNYNALGVTKNALDEPVADIARFLRSGKNVTTTAIDHFLYPAAAGGGMATPGLLAEIEAACEEGQTTFYQSGATPGFALDFWPIAMSRVARRIKKVTVTEIVDLHEYGSPSVLREFMGFARPPEPLAPFFVMMSDIKASAYYPSMRMVSDQLKLGVDDYTFSYEFALTEEPYDQASGWVETGTVSVAKVSYTGYRGEHEVFELRFIWRMTDTVAPDWPAGDGRWILNIDGDPRIDAEVQVTTEWDARRATSIMTAMAPVNAIPAVVAASPGIKTQVDLPFFGGGYGLG